MFKGQVWLVTGAGRGIGRHLVESLAMAGALVALVGRDESRLAETATALQPHGVETLVLPGDVADAPLMASHIDHVATRFGRLDGVIANAGIGVGGLLLDQPPEQWTRVIETNLTGVLHTLLPAIPHMQRQGGGSLVAMSSPAGWRGMPGSALYSATKAAVNILMESLRVEYPKLHVCTVLPGFVLTDMTSHQEGMPWLMQPDRAARIILRGIRKKRRIIAFPWQMNLAARFIRLLPAAIYERLARRFLMEKRPDRVPKPEPRL